MIPKNLAEVAVLVANGESFNRSLGKFLNGFRAHPHAESLAPEPRFLSDLVAGLGAYEDAYLAATAEWLAIHHGFAVPKWVHHERRRLHHPWFASSPAPARAVLLWESPAPFRSRNLFVSANALTRA